MSQPTPRRPHPRRHRSGLFQYQSSLRKCALQKGYTVRFTTLASALADMSFAPVVIVAV